MALIDYSEYFDFDGFKREIKEMDTANKQFGTSVLSLNKEILASYKEVRADIQSILEVLKSFNVNTRGAADGLAEMGKQSATSRQRLAEQEAAIQALIQVQNLNNAAVKEMKVAAKGLQSQYEALSGASADVQAKKAALAQEAQRLTAAIKIQTVAFKATKTVVDDAAGSYNALNNENKELLRQLKAMPNAWDLTTGRIQANNAAAVELQKKILANNDSLKKMDASLGNFQRNVGDYKSGFSGLSNSISQITREFPSFANSVQTGFLAISNNLPIFFDQLKMTKTELAAMRAEGKQVPSVMSALASSFFSWGTALSLGITLLTVYGKDMVDFIGKMIKGHEAIDEVRKSTELLSKAFEDTSVQKAVANVHELRTNIELAKQGFISKEGAVKQYNDTIGKTTGLVNTLDQAEQALVRNGDAYIKFTLYKAAAQLALEEAVKKSLEAEQTRVKKEKEFSKIGDFNTLGFAGQGGAAALKAAEEDVKKQRQKRREDAAKESEKDGKVLEDIADKFQKKAAEISKKYKFNFFEDNKKDKDSDREARRALNDYEKWLRERQELLKRQLEESLAIEQGRRDRDEISEVEFQDKKLQLSDVYAKKAIELETRANKVGYKAKESKVKEFNNVRLKAEEEFDTAIIKVGKDHDKAVVGARMKVIEDLAAIETAGVKDQQQRALANQMLTNQERVKLELQYQNELDQIQIDSLRARANVEIDYDKKKALRAQAALLERGINTRTNFANDITIPQSTAKDQVAALQYVFEQRKLINQTTIADELKTQQAIYKILKDSKQLSIEQEREWSLKLKKLTQDVNAYIIGSLKDAASVTANYIGAPFDSVFNDISDVFLKLQNKAKITWDNIGTYASDASSFATAIFKSGIDQQISALQYRENQELAAVGNNQSAQAQIREKYARQEAALRRKQAVADRNNAIFHIAIDTAQAVIKSVASSPLTFGLPFSAFALAAGALQTALVLSKPLPQYAKGTEHSKEGFAIVDEKGPELIMGPDGRVREVGGMSVGPDGRLREAGKGARVTWLEKGSKVKTAEETKRLLYGDDSDKIIREIEANRRDAVRFTEYKQKEAIQALSTAIQMNGMNEAIITKAFKSAVKDIPIHQTVIDREGERLRVIDGNHRTTYLNQFKIGKN